MSYFNRNKGWAIAFVLLVALNVATLLTFWLVKERRHGPPPVQTANIAGFLSHELGFDSTQKQQLEKLLDAQQQQIREIRRNNREAKDAFFALLKEDHLTDARIDSASKLSSQYDSQMDAETFRNFRAIRNLCNEAQKKKFDNIIHQVLRMIAPPPGKPQGPPPGRDGAPPPDGPPPGHEGEGPPQ